MAGQKFRGFDRIVYVTKEGAGTDDEVTLVWDNEEASGVDEDIVAIYELKELRTLKLTSSLESLSFAGPSPSVKD